MSVASGGLQRCDLVRGPQLKGGLAVGRSAKMDMDDTSMWSIDRQARCSTASAQVSCLPEWSNPESAFRLHTIGRQRRRSRPEKTWRLAERQIAEARYAAWQEVTPKRSCSRAAARCSARSVTRSPAPTSPRSCSRRRHRAKIIGLANAGGDTINSIKQASEFGIVQGGQKLAGLLIFITDIHALELETAQGLIFTDPWYWDQNNANRAFAKEYFAAHGRMPSYTVVGVYSAVFHYLRAVEALDSHADGKA